MATTTKTTKATTAKKTTTAAKAPAVSSPRKIRNGAPNRPSRLTMAYLEQRLDWIESQLESKVSDYPELVSQKEEESVDAGEILASAKELLGKAKSVTSRGRVSKVVDEDEDRSADDSNDDEDADLIDVSL